MDGLPKNKKPWGKAEERKPLALDDYLFERKLQEVYDKKEVSDDMPELVKKFQRLTSKVKNKVKRNKSQTSPKKAKKKQVVYIDTPQATKKKFTKLLTKTKTKTKKPVAVKKRRTYSLRPVLGGAKRHKKRTVAVGAVLVILVLGGLVLPGGKKNTETPSPQVAGVATPTKPSFETLVPNEKAKSSVKFDPTRQVASYQDTIQGARVVVSQQKLSEKDLVDPNFLSRTATAFNLTTEVTTKKGQAFIGVNLEKNTQFAMFTYKEFLVFIQADQSYKNQTIVEYIDSLE